jgi:hypothetical protein
VKNDYGTEQEAWALNGLEEPLKKKIEEYIPIDVREVSFHDANGLTWLIIGVT